MERNALEELRAHLMTTNEEFRQLASQHSEYAKQLDSLESLPHLTADQELEETRLKKMKLRFTRRYWGVVVLALLKTPSLGQSHNGDQKHRPQSRASDARA